MRNGFACLVRNRFGGHRYGVLCLWMIVVYSVAHSVLFAAEIDTRKPENNSAVPPDALQSLAVVEQYIFGLVGNYGHMSREDKWDALHFIEEARIGNEAVRALLEKTQSDSDLTTRSVGLRVALGLRLVEGEAWLQEALSHPDARVRSRAIMALQFSGEAGSEHLQRIRHALERDPDGRVRVCAAGAMCMVTINEMIGPLMARLADEKEDAGVRIACAFSLVNIERACPAGAQYVRSAVKAEAGSVSDVATLVMAVSGDVEALERFVREKPASEDMRYILETVFAQTAHQLFDEDAIKEYVKPGSRISVEAVREWMQDNQGRIRWDSNTGKFTVTGKDAHDEEKR